MELIANGISKMIHKKQVLDQISLRLESGQVYGFVGRNGSGKTMLFRALSGLMKVSSGKVIYDGKVLGEEIQMIPEMGLVIENAGLYPELSGYENLLMLSKLKGIISPKEIREMVIKVGLDPDDKRPYRKYSLGMKQRIVLAQAFMERPKVLFLDEPTNALDTGGVDMVRQLIVEEKTRGALVLIASHNREDIDFLADQVYHIEKGRIEERAQ